MRVLSLFSLLTLFCLSAIAKAQTTEADLLPKAGVSEVTLRGNIQLDPGNNYDFGTSLGYFVNDSLAIQGRLAFNQTRFSSNSPRNRSLALGLGGQWHFRNRSATLPFVGVFGDGTWYDPGFAPDDDDTLRYGFQVGVKQFLTRNVALQGSVDFIRYDDSGFVFGNLSQRNEIRLLFGLGIYLGHR